MAYTREIYMLRRFEIVAPHVRNDGTPSGYPEALAEALAGIGGFTGWTEHAPHVGYWEGKREAGTRFELFAPNRVAGVETADLLANIARSVMPDQDAIQLVVGEVIELREA